MPNNLSSNIQLDIMAIAMNETIIKPDPPLLDFRIAELSVNSNTPYKYHFRHIVELQEQLRRKRNSKEKGQEVKKKTQLVEILKDVKTEALGTIPLKIQANGTYTGLAFVTISCVEAECGKCENCKNKNFGECFAKSIAHPHVVTGEFNEDPKGVKFFRSINIENIGQEFTFKIGIMSTKKNDIKEVLKLQGESFNPKREIDLHRVKLRVQFSLADNPSGTITHTGLSYSSTIYNKHNSAYKKMEIKKMFSDNRSPMDGGKDIMITGNIPANVSSNTSENGKSAEESNVLQVCFDGLTGPDGKSYTLCIADPEAEIFQSCGLVFKTPGIPKEYQSNSDILARIFLRKAYPCGRQDESNKLNFVFEPPKLADNLIQETAPGSPTQTVILMQNDSGGEVCTMRPPQKFPQINHIASQNHINNFGDMEWNVDQVGYPVVQGTAPSPSLPHLVTFGQNPIEENLVQNPEGEIYTMGPTQEWSQLNTLANVENHRNMVENHEEEVQKLAPQELVTLQNVLQAPSTEYIINFIANAESNTKSNVEDYNAIEQFPSEIFDQTSTDPNSQMAKILAQASNGSLVEFLANSQQEEGKASNTNDNNAEKKPTKRSAQNLVNSEGKMLSNSIYLTNGGPKPRKKGQEDASKTNNGTTEALNLLPVNSGDFDLLSDTTMKLLTIANQELSDEILEDIENSVNEFKGIL